MNAQPGGPDAGDSTVNTYDTLGRVTSQTGPMGYTTTFSYCVNPAAGDCMNPATGTGYVTITDPDGNTTVDDYTQGALAAETRYTATTLTTEHDYNPITTAGTGTPSAGTLLDASETDGNGNTTTYTYDSAGNSTSATGPSPAGGSATTTSAYTSFSQQDCGSTALASPAATCTQDAGPAPVAPGGVITPPSTAPPVGLTWTLYDTDGNQLYTTAGAYPPRFIKRILPADYLPALQPQRRHSQRHHDLMRGPGAVAIAAMRRHQRRRSRQPARL